MATPLFSKTIDITIDGSVVGCATDYTFNSTKGMIEIHCMNSTNNSVQNIPDLISYNISVNGFVFRDTALAGMGFYALMDNFHAGDADASIYWAVTPDVSTQRYLNGYGYVQSLSQSGGVGAAVTYSFDVIGTGDISVGQSV